MRDVSRLRNFIRQANIFAARAAATKDRVRRNTLLSLEQSCRALAAQEAEADDSRSEPADAG